jgi:hypothetical protein
VILDDGATDADSADRLASNDRRRAWLAARPKMGDLAFGAFNTFRRW